MSQIVIPFDPTNADQQMHVSLGGTTYLFRLVWNSRAAVWHVSLATDDEAPIVSGAPVLAGWDPMRPYVRENEPPGRFILVDAQATNENGSPGRLELGRDARFKLVYDDGT